MKSVDVNMPLDEMVSRITSCCPEVSKEMVLERLQFERVRTGGLLSDEALVRLIAADLGCDVSSPKAVARELLLLDLIPGLNDISVTGRVVALFPSKTFKGARKGRLASLLIADESGITRVVLWNDKAELVETERVKIGDVVHIRHGYTREDYGGKVEVQAGEKCMFDVNPTGVNAEVYPFIDRFTVKTKDLPRLENGSRVNLTGTVLTVSSPSEFERSDASVGKVLRLVLSDDTGEACLVFWNEKVDEVQGLLKAEPGLQVINAKVKKAATDEKIEVHVDGSTCIGAWHGSEFTPLADLKEGLEPVSVAGEVASKPTVRDLKTSKNEIVKLATFELKDETGKIWVSAWRDHADAVKDLQVDDRIIIKNACVKRGYGETLELSTRYATSIHKTPNRQNQHSV